VFRSQRGTFDKGLQLGPGHLWVSSAAEAAVGAGDTALRAKDFLRAPDSLGHKFGKNGDSEQFRNCSLSPFLKFI
jgi:hypothetical protein